MCSLMRRQALRLDPCRSLLTTRHGSNQELTARTSYRDEQESTTTSRDENGSPPVSGAEACRCLEAVEVSYLAHVHRCDRLERLAAAVANAIEVNGRGLDSSIHERIHPACNQPFWPPKGHDVVGGQHLRVDLGLRDQVPAETSRLKRSRIRIGQRGPTH